MFKNLLAIPILKLLFLDIVDVIKDNIDLKEKIKAMEQIAPKSY